VDRDAALPFHPLRNEPLRHAKLLQQTRV